MRAGGQGGEEGLGKKISTMSEPRDIQKEACE